MIPIWAWNKETQKWELFPLDLLEDFEDGLKGFDKNYWYASASVPEVAPLVVDMALNKYRKHFAKQYFSNTSYGNYRYVFLPGLPLLTRWKLKAVEKAKILPEASSPQSPDGSFTGDWARRHSNYYCCGDHRYHAIDRRSIKMKPICFFQ